MLDRHIIALKYSTTMSTKNIVLRLLQRNIQNEVNRRTDNPKIELKALELLADFFEFEFS